MGAITLTHQLAALGVLLVVSAFFSIAETSMMALNRYRLKAMVRMGNRAARRVSELLARTDRLLGVILLGNNLVNAAAATLTLRLTALRRRRTVRVSAEGAPPRRVSLPKGRARTVRYPLTVPANGTARVTIDPGPPEPDAEQPQPLLVLSRVAVR